ncbi:sulfatase-like hydrolase/transferase [Haloferax namakaokahaiae]|uniref:Sulfatase-like hydrolase/transferase n=1 Tax=Haloferax namakaokahaiae TaxID=1748331 RepID=A0ABD5ZBV7_9EURY
MSNRNMSHGILVLVPDCLRAAEREKLNRIEERTDLSVSNCYSSGTWTLPAHATLVSGESPDIHGASRRGDTLPAGKGKIPRHAQDAGYTSVLVTENPTFGSSNGFDDGMDVVDEDVDLKRYPTSWSPARVLSDKSVTSGIKACRDILTGETPLRDTVNTLTSIKRHFADVSVAEFPHHGDCVLAHLEDHMNRHKPVFAVANLLDTHNPHYCPPPESELTPSLSEIEALYAACDNRGYVFKEPLPAKTRSEFERWGTVQSWMEEIYQHQAAYVDRLVSDWFDSNYDRLQNALVVIVGDHGQLFGDEGMVGHHVSTHPHGISVPAFISFPDSWELTEKNIDTSTSLVGLAQALDGVISGEITSVDSFTSVWEEPQVATYVDGPTWRVNELRDQYGEDASALDELEILKISIINDGVQTVHSCPWGGSEIETTTYEISPDNREKANTPVAPLSESQREWLQDSGLQQTGTAVNARLEALGYK